jgi:hypothetical protein
MAGQRQAAGIEVKMDPQSYPHDRFARVHDPDGNPIELWQPRSPRALGLWYQQHPRVSLISTSYEESRWQQEAGPTAFAPFKETSGYFGDAQKVWMLNFRVRDRSLARKKNPPIPVTFSISVPPAIPSRTVAPTGGGKTFGCVAVCATMPSCFRLQMKLDPKANDRVRNCWRL